MCWECGDSGTRRGGTGHRIGRYPYTETEVEENCTCAKGRALSQQDRSATQDRIDQVRREEDYVQSARKEMGAALARDDQGKCAACLMPADLDELKDNYGICQTCDRSSRQ